MSDITLKPCPFCGNVPGQPGCFRGNTETMIKWGCVECSCGVRGPEARAQYRPVAEWAPAAAAEWNKRAGDGG